ncbi:MAG: coproporphyrinogen dehydrogenase HemZ [Clostridia bacterium]|nr:coproporphyrinogen dehydrogenase HemZ [Clostridia bacterium]
MVLVNKGHSFNYETENLCRVFFPLEKIEVLSEEKESDRKIITEKINNRIRVTICFGNEEKMLEKVLEDDDDSELEIATLLFKLLCEETSYVPQWGLLTGVRPSKLMLRLIEDTDEEKAEKYFKEKLLVSDKKTSLAMSVAKCEEKIISRSEPESFSLYISIPFCPTRCNYCSFVSHSIEKTKKLIKPYVENLCEEIRLTGKIAKDLNLKLETVYFGGGTPTTLEAAELEKLLTAVKENFDLSTCFEYTVEAGRPDTVTREKLDTLKSNNVTRISINPQTFNDKVLENIGRRHTAEETINAFKMSREAGFDNINMDLIAGLSSDTAESFSETLDIINELSPENVTVHTLALKRSSYLAGDTSGMSDGLLANEMINLSHEKLNSYIPYYMYRQSKSLGNLENVGWCKKGYECAYNIFMMEECHTILACGAGAVTKLKDPDSNAIERIFNFKYPYEYNDRLNELFERKQRIYEFYRSR